MSIVVFNPNIASLLLRVVLGMIFVYHGWPKLQDKHKYSKLLFEGSPTGCLLLATIEFVGGLALIFGFLTELSSLMIFVIMLGAIYYKIKRWRITFFSDKATGWEYDLVLAVIALSLLFLGAGAFSVDAYVGII